MSNLKYKNDASAHPADTYTRVNCLTPYGTLYRQHVISQKCVKIVHRQVGGTWFHLIFPNLGSLVIPENIYREIHDNNIIHLMADAARSFLNLNNSTFTFPTGKVTPAELDFVNKKQPKRSLGIFWTERELEAQKLLEAAAIPYHQLGKSHE